MGYYTDFELTWKGDVDEDELLGKLQSVSGYYGWELDFELIQSKWYNWSEDMKTLSKEFPEVEFHLSGDGEDRGDIWQATFKNGKKIEEKKGRIVFD